MLSVFASQKLRGFAISRDRFRCAVEVNGATRTRGDIAKMAQHSRAVTFLDVTTSRGTYEQAQIDRLNAIYDYHKAFAALESAVGRPLR